jgi:hypothetical protein
LLNGTLFGQWTFELASYGIVSVVDGKPQTKANDDPIVNGIRSGPDGKPMAMDWITPKMKGLAAHSITSSTSARSQLPDSPAAE